MIGRFIGTVDARLSPLGQHQAQALAAFLEDAPIDAVLASPRRRSMEMVLPVAKEKGLEVEARQGFAEMHFGAWEGLSWPEIQDRDGAFAAQWKEDPATVACPDGQCADDFAQVVHQELSGILEEFAGRTVLIGAHAGVNRAILGSILERPYMETFRFAQDYGCVNAAAWGDGWRQVALVNFVPGPRSEHPSW